MTNLKDLSDEELVRLRDNVKKDISDLKYKLDSGLTLDFTLKVLLNSCYGVLANKFSPLCDTDNAGSITLTGQAVVQQASSIIELYAKEKYKVTTPLCIYSDTDSSHLTLQPILDQANIELIRNNKVTKEGLNLVDKELSGYLNEKITEWAKSELKSTDPRYFFKRESICDVAVYLEKKRYILHVLNDEGANVNKFKYVGVEIARSTTPKKAKTLIKQIIENSLLVQDQVKANELYKKAYDEFKQLPIDDVAVRGGLSDLEKYDRNAAYPFKIAKGTPNHVKGAIYYNHLLKMLNIDVKYEKIVSGNKVKKVYIDTNKYQIGTLCYPSVFPEEFTEFKVDYIKMFETLIEPPVKAVYEAIGWRLPDVINEPQVDLFELLG